mgnify:CR=1 FL=1
MVVGLAGQRVYEEVGVPIPASSPSAVAKTHWISISNFLKLASEAMCLVYAPILFYFTWHKTRWHDNAQATIFFNETMQHDKDPRLRIQHKLYFLQEAKNRFLMRRELDYLEITGRVSQRKKASFPPL